MAAYARTFGVQGIAMLAEMAGLKEGGKLAEPDSARVAAIRELLDRGFGKAAQLITGDPDQPLAISFEWAPATPVASETKPVSHETTIDVEPVEIEWSSDEPQE